MERPVELTVTMVFEAEHDAPLEEDIEYAFDTTVLSYDIEET
ncbi:MAG: hypothetical protein V4510_12795 [bacterium]